MKSFNSIAFPYREKRLFLFAGFSAVKLTDPDRALHCRPSALHLRCS